MFALESAGHLPVFWCCYNATTGKLNKSFWPDPEFEYWESDWSYDEYGQWMTV